MNNLLLFTNNLRIHDNPALYNAAISGLPVIGVYIDDTQDLIGKKGRIWLYQSLLNLKNTLKEQYNFDLYILKGDKIQILEKIISKNNIKNLYIDAHDVQFKNSSSILQSINIFRYNSACLSHYNYQEFIRYSESFQVFFNHSKSVKIREVVAKPIRMICQSLQPDDSLEIVNNIIHKDIPHWHVGENSALNKLSSFSIKYYSATRNRLDYDSTSYLSPHIRFGEISVVHIYHRLNNLINQPQLSNDINQFIKQLLLRDFMTYSYAVDLNSQNTKHKNLLSYNKDLISKWQQGETGYKIIDAAMQQLLQTGWMHNRARMITSSFLIKNLLQDYSYGQQWFFDNLYDADIAINHLSWLIAAGFTNDATPSFRIFNPELQAKRYDPKQKYTNKWQCFKSSDSHIIDYKKSCNKWINFLLSSQNNES